MESGDWFLLFVRPPADERRVERDDGEGSWRPHTGGGESGWRQREKEREGKWLPPSLRGREQPAEKEGGGREDTERLRMVRDDADRPRDPPRDEADRPRTYRDDGERAVRRDEDERPRGGERDDANREPPYRGPPRDEERRGGWDERGPQRDEERQGGGGWRGGASGGGYSHRDERDSGRDRDRDRDRGGYGGGPRGGDERRRDDYQPQRRDQPRDYPPLRRDEPREDLRRDRPPRDQPSRDHDYRRDDRVDRERPPADDHWAGASGGGGAPRDTHGDRDDRPAPAAPRRIDYHSRPDRDREARDMQRDDRRRPAARGSSPPHPVDGGGDDEDVEGGWQKVSKRWTPTSWFQMVSSEFSVN